MQLCVHMLQNMNDARSEEHIIVLTHNTQMRLIALRRKYASRINCRAFALKRIESGKQFVSVHILGTNEEQQGTALFELMDYPNLLDVTEVVTVIKLYKRFVYQLDHILHIILMHRFHSRVHILQWK